MIGRLLDLNFTPDGEAVELWLRLGESEVERVRVEWMPSVCAVGPGGALEELARAFCERSELVTASEEPGRDPRPALRIRAKAWERREVARLIESSFGRSGVRVYDVDVPALQQFLYEHGLFPTALVEVSGDRLRTIDSREDADYDVSWVRVAELEVSTRRGSAYPGLDEPLGSVRLTSREGEVELDGDEPGVLEELMRAVEPFDVLLVKGG
ncbi:MAG: hypothetical protein NZ733_06595, partial [Aigarchaeota archaeon]|nr:hypothetical protein [Aigarchaeota archaeon]